jgi:hypothetical protein
VQCRMWHHGRPLNRQINYKWLDFVRRWSHATPTEPITVAFTIVDIILCITFTRRILSWWMGKGKHGKKNGEEMKNNRDLHHCL